MMGREAVRMGRELGASRAEAMSLAADKQSQSETIRRLNDKVSRLLTEVVQYSAQLQVATQRVTNLETALHSERSERKRLSDERDRFETDAHSKVAEHVRQLETQRDLV
jgi:hypothetical protein